MASTATSWSPGSLQLRLALGNRNGRIFSEFLIRSRFSSLNCPVRLRYVARTGERRRKSSSLIVSESAPDTLSGWSEEDGNGEKSVEPQKNKLFGGMVGAGLAGVVLFAGLAFAASSLSKRSTSRQNPKMESLTTEQGALISSDEKNEKVVEDGRDDNNVKQDSITMENDTEKDVNDNDNASNPEDLQPEPPSNDVSVAPEATTSLPDLSEPEAVTGISVAPIVIDPDGSMAASLTEPTPETIKENHVDVDSANLTNPTDLSTEYQQGLPAPTESNNSLDSSYSASVHLSFESVDVNQVVSSDSNLKPPILPKDDVESFAPPYTKEDIELSDKPQVSAERDSLFLEEQNFNEGDSSEKESVSESTYPISNENETYDLSEISGSKPISESPTSGGSFSPAGIPAPSVVSAALQVNPGKVLVPAVVDQVQGQALAALQVLKVIEADVQPSDLCTRREYARWLVSASGALSRNTVSKVYPAMYIENVTELAFDDITPEDPDFSFIQGLAEAGLISSKLSHRDLLNEEPGPFNFSPESPLSRQDLVSWKMALEKRQLPEADRKILYQLSGFIDIDKISPDAWPALVADMSGGEQGITSLAFGCTRLFQPGKPVTKAQAAIALATGEASDMVSEELARIEAESAAENAVSAHNALIAEVEKDINASFEKELSLEREKIDAVEKMAEEARQELERLRVEREGEKIAMMKERAAIDSEMEILSKLRREVEDQLESLMSNKVEISYEKERISKLKQEAEFENQEITRLQHELEVEKKALSMARSWAEEEAKRAREQAKALEEARSRWKKHGIKVEVDNDLQEETDAAVTWTNARKQISVEETVNRAETLANKLKKMANDIKGKSREVIDIIIQKIRHFISALKEWASKAGKRAEELKDTSVIKAKESAQELQRRTEELQLAVKEGAKRVAGDCREGVEKLSQKFKHDE